LQQPLVFRGVGVGPLLKVDDLCYQFFLAHLTAPSKEKCALLNMDGSEHFRKSLIFLMQLGMRPRD
jgi:hypothetical protein